MEVWTVYNRNKLFWSCDLPWVEVWTVYNYQWIALIMWFILSGSMNCIQLKWIVLIMWFTLSGSMNCIQLEMDCPNHVIYLEWKNELYTTGNGLSQSCDLPWVEVWTVYNWKWIVLIMWFTLSGSMNCIQLKWIVLIILWFTLSGSMNCIQLEAGCSDHIVIYLE